MSVRKETYIIYGVKFGEEFTEEFWEMPFSDEMQWNEEKEKDKPFFITDGMSGEYTYFGFITQLNNGFDDDETEVVINSNLDFSKIRNKFFELYPTKIFPEPMLYYLPHYV